MNLKHAAQGNNTTSHVTLMITCSKHVNYRAATNSQLINQVNDKILINKKVDTNFLRTRCSSVSIWNVKVYEAQEKIKTLIALVYIQVFVFLVSLVLISYLMLKETQCILVTDSQHSPTLSWAAVWVGPRRELHQLITALLTLAQKSHHQCHSRFI